MKFVKIYDRKTLARHFDAIRDIQQCLSLMQTLLKGRIALIWRIGNRGVKICGYRILVQYNVSESDDNSVRYEFGACLYVAYTFG